MVILMSYEFYLNKKEGVREEGRRGGEEGEIEIHSV